MRDQVDCDARADTPEVSKSRPTWQPPFRGTKPQTDHRNNVLFLELLVSLRIVFAPAFNTAKRIAGSWPGLAEAKVPKELGSSQDKVQLIGDILPSHSPTPFQKEDGCFTTA